MSLVVFEMLNPNLNMPIPETSLFTNFGTDTAPPGAQKGSKKPPSAKSDTFAP